MCFPYASSELWKEWKELGWNDTTRDPNNDTSWKYYDGYFKEDYSWPKQKANMDKIKAAAEAAELLHITGGEPTINPEFFDLLGHLIKSGKSKEITLDVTTNATKIHPRFFEVAKQFKELWLTISMDGVGKTYEYVRYPANFETVYGNILRYQKFVKELGGNSRLVFNFVLQLWNLHNAIETVKTLSPLAVNDSRAPIRIEELTDPIFMHWSLLPEEHIKKAVKQIRTENTHLGNKIEWGVIALSRIMKTYKDHDTKNSVLLTQRLKAFTTKQDRHRGIDLKNYIPSLSEFLE
jgi:MoaA/NifB/PqqE/SkfB family radical SAM enzyme